jgi:UPF0271 protein
MRSVDLNCDMGEGCGNDAELMKFISSANIACGFHAGDIDTMRRTAEIAVANNVAIGAHPGYPDRENFGRTAMSLPSKEIFNIVREQVLSMTAICSEFHAPLHHVKAHGALYNQAAKDRELAAAIAEAVSSVSPTLILYGLSGSLLIEEAETAGLRTASEVFADRTYQIDGSLTPRTQSGAMLDDADSSIAQVLQMIESQSVTALTGENIPLRADTICIHGDGESAVEIAGSIYKSILARGIEVRTI